MRRIATATFTLLALLLTTTAAQAQFVEEWEKSKADENAPDYIASGEGYNARGIAYGMVDDGTGTMVERVFVASNASGNYQIYVLDPQTGDELTTLDMTGVSGGFRTIEDVGVSDDGIIIGCNLALGQFAQQEFKCYRWDDLSAAPTTIISGVAVNDRTSPSRALPPTTRC